MLGAEFFVDLSSEIEYFARVLDNVTVVLYLVSSVHRHVCFDLDYIHALVPGLFSIYFNRYISGGKTNNVHMHPNCRYIPSLQHLVKSHQELGLEVVLRYLLQTACHNLIGSGRLSF